MKLEKTFNCLPLNINHGYIHSCIKGKLRRFPSKEVKAWKTELGWAFKGKWNLDGNYRIIIYIQMGDKRRRDVDSGIKFILDALSGIIYKDDNQVQSLWVLKSRGKEHKTTITVEEIEN